MDERRYGVFLYRKNRWFYICNRRLSFWESLDRIYQDSYEDPACTNDDYELVIPHELTEWEFNDASASH